MVIFCACVGSMTNSTPVTGSSDSCTTRCLVPRSCMRSPRMTVTAPLAKPTAIWDRSSSAEKADILKPWLLVFHSEESEESKRPNHDEHFIGRQQLTGNCFRPLFMFSVLKQVGNPVFFTGLSRAQTFKTGSLLKSSYKFQPPSSFLSLAIFLGHNT